MSKYIGMYNKLNIWGNILCKTYQIPLNEEEPDEHKIYTCIKSYFLKQFGKHGNCRLKYRYCSLKLSSCSCVKNIFKVFLFHFKIYKISICWFSAQTIFNKTNFYSKCLRNKVKYIVDSTNIYIYILQCSHSDKRDKLVDTTLSICKNTRS